MLLDGLSPGQAFTIGQHDVTLSGLLADGTPFSFDLISEFDFSRVQDFFCPESTLTVTLIPEEALLGDCNQDGNVSFLDISPFIAKVTVGEFQVEADTNQDGEVDFLDITSFIELLFS